MTRVKIHSIISIAIRLILVGLLIWALGKHPYGYYILLRWIVCVVALYNVYLSAESDRLGWIWVFAPIALLFNPIIPVHLDRGSWQFIDVVTAILFFVSIFFLRVQQPKQEGKEL